MPGRLQARHDHHAGDVDQAGHAALPSHPSLVSNLPDAILSPAPAADPPATPPPAASALERLRGKLSQPLDPRDPLSALAPLIDSLRSARQVGGDAVRSPEPGAPAPRSMPPESFPTLDEFLAGGLPRGKLVEMIGARSSGRFSAVLAALAAATAAGEAAALVDLGDGLDPQAAAALGVDLGRLLWLRPATLKQALAGAEILLGGGFPMVALDLGNPPIRGGRGAEAAWLRLARAAQAHGAALLVASPYRVSGTAAAAVLRAARGRPRWLGSIASRRTVDSFGTLDALGALGTLGKPGGAPWLLDGLSCQVTLEKCRGRQLPAGALGLDLRLWPELAGTDPFATAPQATTPEEERIPSTPRTPPIPQTNRPSQALQLSQLPQNPQILDRDRHRQARRI
jgi:hypothetical protein